MMIFLVYVYYYTIRVFSWSRKKYVGGEEFFHLTTVLGLQLSSPWFQTCCMQCCVVPHCLAWKRDWHQYEGPQRQRLPPRGVASLEIK